MATRRVALVLAALLLLGACGGDDSDGDAGLGDDSSQSEDTSATDTTGGGDAADECADVALEETEVGVSADQIHIAVAADTGSPLRPGLFQGSVDAIEGWAAWVNDNGGLACREVVVDSLDTKLSADESHNAVIAACEDSVALVGTTAVFLNAAGMSEAEQCSDRAGAATGIPDLAVLQTEPAQQCSVVSFAVIAGTGACPYGGEGERTYTERMGTIDYYLEEYGDLHGVWAIPSDLPSTLSASMPGFRASQELGIGLDDEAGLSTLSEQSAYTPLVQAIKEHGSTYARVGIDYRGTVFLRKEAQTQGVESVQVWDCSLQCYDARLISEGGDAVEGQFMWIQFLPLEDAGSNDTLDAFLDAVDRPDGFGAQAWASAEFFRAVVEKIVEADGPNAITRARLLETIPTMGEFDAGGFIPPTDIGSKAVNGCFVLMQVQDGEFVRVLPEEPGTFQCDSEHATYDITLDAVAEYQG